MNYENKVLLEVEKSNQGINGTRISDKYCRLLIEIAKEIFSQYVKQLKDAHRELAVLLENDKRYLNSQNTRDFYKKLSTAVNLSENILNKFEKNIFLGRVDDNYLSYIDAYGEHLQPANNKTKSELERFVTYNGISGLFRIVGIPEDVIVTSINYSKENLFLNNSEEGRTILEDRKDHNLQDNSNFLVKLVFNNILSSNLNGLGLRAQSREEQTMFYSIDINTKHPGKKFNIDMSKVYEIIENFLQNEFQSIQIVDDNYVNNKNLITQETFYNLFDIYRLHSVNDVKSSMNDNDSYKPYGETGQKLM